MIGPTPEQAAQIRRLAEAAGSADDLIRWVRAVVPAKRGRPPGSSPVARKDAALLGAVREASIRGGLPVSALVRVNVLASGAGAWGPTKEAVIDRLQGKARASG